MHLGFFFVLAAVVVILASVHRGQNIGSGQEQHSHS